MDQSLFPPNFDAPVETEQTPLDQLWEAARYYIHCAYVMFGGPQKLAEQSYLSRKDHKHCSDWLYRCEELMRRLIFIHALRFFWIAMPKTKPRPFPISYSYETKSLAFDPENPRQWRVSFDLNASPLGPPASPPASTNSSEQSAGRRDAGGPSETAPVLCCTALARRLEALRRAALNPLHVTMRLMRILQRRQNVAALAHKLAQPTRSFRAKNTKPGDLAIVDVIAELLPAFEAWRQRYAPETPALALDTS
ncbi:hypothetical protein U91I_02683 [alpha proteobacterium U9-1i]|nr:hypothetical protein U91I_02683 [alpha proteobacterium U9-1i]